MLIGVNRGLAAAEQPIRADRVRKDRRERPVFIAISYRR